MLFGNWIDAELDKVKGKTKKATEQKRVSRLKALLDEKATKQFADPAMLFSEKGGGED